VILIIIITNNRHNKLIPLQLLNNLILLKFYHKKTLELMNLILKLKKLMHKKAIIIHFRNKKSNKMRIYLTNTVKIIYKNIKKSTTM